MWSFQSGNKIIKRNTQAYDKGTQRKSAPTYMISCEMGHFTAEYLSRVVYRYFVSSKQKNRNTTHSER
jgi:hypothetical protein